MKNNFVAYIFIIFVIGLIGFAVYKIYYEETEPPMQTTVESAQEEEKIDTNLRIPVAGFDSINPIISHNQNIQDISRLVYEPLLKINENNQIELCLAKEWSKVSGNVYLIKLKENVKWHDSIPFEARDVHFTIDRLKNDASSSIYAWNVQHIIGVEVIDTYTIKFTLDGEIPFFEYNLTFPIMASHYYADQDFMTTSKNNNPVGTGQFKAIANNDTITLKKNREWWNIEKEDCKLETITLNKYANMGEVYNAFKIGNIDLLTTSNMNTEGNIGTIGFQTKEYRGRELDYIAFNTTNSILQNVEVRKAIQAAIDKQNIVASVYSNKYYITNFPIEGTSDLYNPEKIQYEYNPDKAKAFLVENGWEYKYKQWQKVQNYRTQKISLNLVVKASNENRVRVAEMIEAQLEAIGMKINVIKASDSQYQNYLKNKNYDMILTGMYLPYGPDLTTYFAQGNLANYNNEELIALTNEVKNITNQDTLKEKYARMQEIYNDQIPYVFLYTNKEMLIYSQKLVGNVNPYRYNVFNNITTWYRQ